MGKRYYCDYCDRSFQDNPHNRKKHLNGVQHHRAKKSWFDNFRDAATVLNEERTKEPCRKFLQTGQCVFGTNCRFSHMSERYMKMLEQKIDGLGREFTWNSRNSGAPPFPGHESNGGAASYSHACVKFTSITCRGLVSGSVEMY
ncbi:zinc finger matrin-type protein 5 isoform X2 [Pseudorasbora parva]|uniref:zinc finger matrin-type protein 5 isoform X2 n=1 Tax=Pseudorasbora parva TaxID=51549 RepID=UPI00351EB4DE